MHGFEAIPSHIAAEIAVALHKTNAETGPTTNVIWVDKDHGGTNAGTRNNPYQTIALAVTNAHATRPTIVLIEASGGGGPLSIYTESVICNKSIIFYAIGDIHWGPVGGAFGWQNIVLRLSGPVTRFGKIGFTMVDGGVADGSVFGLVIEELALSGGTAYSEVNELFVLLNKYVGTSVLLAGTASVETAAIGVVNVGLGYWILRNNIIIGGGASLRGAPDNVNVPFSPTLTSVAGSNGCGFFVSGSSLMDTRDNLFVHENVMEAKFDVTNISGFDFDANTFTLGTIANVRIGQVIYIKSGVMNQTRVEITNVVGNTITVNVDVGTGGMIAGDTVWTGYEQGQFITNDLSIKFGVNVLNIALGSFFNPTSIINNAFEVRDTDLVFPYDLSIVEAVTPFFGIFHFAAKANKIKIGSTIYDNRDFPISDSRFSGILDVIDTHVHESFTKAVNIGKDDSRFRSIDYNGKVIIDPINGSAGTNYPIGTSNSPVDNIVDAKSIADKLGVRVYNIRGTIILDVAHTNWSFKGIAGHDVDILNLNNQVVIGSKFEDLEITGQCNGAITLTRCDLDSVTNLEGEGFQCGFEGVCSIAAGSSPVFIDCYSDVLGATTPIIDMQAGSASSLGLRGYKGGVEIRNLDQVGDNLSIDMVAGQIILAASCTNGTAVLRGNGKLVNNSVGTTVDVTALVPEVLKRVLGLIHENMYIDQTFYVGKVLTSGRKRLYSDAASVGTDSNVIATYQIIATQLNGKIITYKETLV